MLNVIAGRFVLAPPSARDDECRESEILLRKPPPQKIKRPAKGSWFDSFLGVAESLHRHRAKRCDYRDCCDNPVLLRKRKQGKQESSVEQWHC